LDPLLMHRGLPFIYSEIFYLIIFYNMSSSCAFEGEE
jgi:hypothetical protein